MDPNFQGDLTDILRGSTTSTTTNSSGFGDRSGDATWHFSPETNDSSAMISVPDPMPFGDPFSNMRDPLLQGPSAFFGGSDTAPEFFGPSHEAKFRPNCNGFSRMLQINPGGSVPAPDQPGRTMQCDNSASPKAGDGVVVVLAAENAAQISSPRNAGIKRRKSQAKKVVCIPAPAAANSRTSGEVVPSDLWAWRKYGQKPIKGSPYPRGYYRCSSSKGCSARKQVERSRTDPNMLVITYTSEHNHPWPTQRNALAGSTRSQPAKTGKGTPPLTSSHSQLGPTSTGSKDESNTDANNASVSVKEENVDITDRLDEDDGDVAFGYRPALCSSEHDALFAELGEIESDPLDLLFIQGLASPVDHNQQHKGLGVTTSNNNDNNDNINNNNDKSLDPFAMFDWSEVNGSESKQRE